MRAWQATYAEQVGADRLAGLDPEHAGRLWGQRLHEPEADHRVQVAVRDGEVVGFVTTVVGGPDDEGEVLALNAHPDHWGTGAGTALLAAAVEELAARGGTGAFLWVAEGNRRARAFYARHGWVAGTARDDVGASSMRGVAVPTVRYRRTPPRTRH